MKARFYLTTILLVIGRPAYSTTGDQVVSDLNFQVNNIVDECRSGMPAWLCSGVIIRVNEGNFPSWEPSIPEQVEMKSLATSLVRSDIPDLYNALWPGEKSYGTIFASPIHPSNSGTSASLLCAYPTNGWSFISDNRGCGVVTKKEDLSSCESEGIYSSADWLTHYANSDILSGCSFSTIRSEYFIESLRTQIEYLENNLIETRWNEMVLDTETINFEDVYSIPIKALFYKDKYLEYAQNEQEFYYAKTNSCVPIVEIVSGENNSNALEPFVFKINEQIPKCTPVL